MKTWFDKRRLQMLNDACEKVLSPQLQGALTFADIIQIAGLLEAHNNEATIKNAIKLQADNIGEDVDVVSEICSATVAETVLMFDTKTISNFIWGAEKEHVLDLSEDSNDNTPLTFIGDKLEKIPKKIQKIVDYFPDDGKCFVLCTPFMISLLQSAARTRFVPTGEGAFNGPNHTVLWGSLNKTPVYSYLPAATFDADSNDEDMIIIGNYQKTKDGAVTQRLVVKNLSFE